MVVISVSIIDWALSVSMVCGEVRLSLILCLEVYLTIKIHRDVKSVNALAEVIQKHIDL